MRLGQHCVALDGQGAPLGDRFERLDAAQVGAGVELGRLPAEAVGDRPRLCPPGFGQRTLTIVAVPPGPAAGLGMTDEMDGHQCWPVSAC